MEMDCTNNLESSKYVITVDTLDLALLPSFYSSRLNNNTASLWTTNNLNTNDYFEFKVKPKADAYTVNKTTINNDSAVTNHQSRQYQCNPSVPRSKLLEDVAITICHMCDIEVPTAYIKDHENSLKHKAYVKIADVVLDRTRKHILKKDTVYIQKNDIMYFCGPCAAEIETVNKHSHEISRAHKRSVSLDRLLYELVALYTDIEEYAEEPSSMRVKKTLDDYADDLKSEVDSNTNNTVLISDVRARLNEFEMKTVENYIKMIDKCEINKSYVLSSVGNDLRISMQDDSHLIVAVDNFNGFMRIDENSILCIVCKMIVGNKDTHKISETHIKNIITPFKDYNCLRNIDNYSSHCVICNKIVNNSDLHILCDETHIKLLKKALVVNENKSNKHNETDSTVYNGFDNSLDYHDPCNETDGNRLLKSITVNETKSKANEAKPYVNITDSDMATMKIDNDTYHCLACNIQMHINNVQSHLNGTKHAMNSKSEVHYLMKQDVGSSDLLCRVCNVYVADYKDQIKEHVATSDHGHKYEELLSNNNVMRQKGDFYCKLCKVVLLKKNELYHIEKLTHEVNLACFKENKTKNYTVSQISNINETISNDSTTSAILPACYCDTCNVFIPNNHHNISTHNDGVRHKKNVLITEVEIADPTESSVVESLDLHYQMDATENEKSLMCKVCKVRIPNIQDNIMEHIIGRKHVFNLKNFVDANNIEIIDEKYFCKDCKLFIKAENLFIHINQTRHKTLLGNLGQKTETAKIIETADSQATTNTSKDKQNNNNTFNINNTNTESIDNLYLKFKHHFLEMENKELLKCKICLNMDIPNTAEHVANHTANQTHLNGYKDLMSDSCIFETEERTYFCAICVCLVPLKGEVHHAKGLKHTGNYDKATAEQNCKLCNIDLYGLNMSQHISSPEHLTKIMKTQSLLHYCEFCKVLMQKDKVEEHANNCHKFAVKDKICFCSICDPYLPNTTRK